MTDPTSAEKRARALGLVIETARKEISRRLDTAYVNARVGGYTPDEVEPLEAIEAILAVADLVVKENE